MEAWTRGCLVLCKGVSNGCLLACNMNNVGVEDVASLAKYVCALDHLRTSSFSTGHDGCDEMYHSVMHRGNNDETVNVLLVQPVRRLSILVCLVFRVHEHRANQTLVNERMRIGRIAASLASQENNNIEALVCEHQAQSKQESENYTSEDNMGQSNRRYRTDLRLLNFQENVLRKTLAPCCYAKAVLGEHVVNNFAILLVVDKAAEPGTAMMAIYDELEHVGTCEFDPIWGLREACKSGSTNGLVKMYGKDWNRKLASLKHGRIITAEADTLYGVGIMKQDGMHGISMKPWSLQNSLSDALVSIVSLYNIGGD